MQYGRWKLLPFITSQQDIEWTLFTTSKW